jgi:hypothetical protein
MQIAICRIFWSEGAAEEPQLPLSLVGYGTVEFRLVGGHTVKEVTSLLAIYAPEMPTWQINLSARSRQLSS